MIDTKSVLMSMVQYTHFISFGLLMLAGLNVPVSEDLIFIISASIAATLVPENTSLIFAGCFLGAYLSDIMAYHIGKYGINRALFNKFFIRYWILNRATLEQKLSKTREYFSRYGGKTLFFGRFVPFGVRNIIFMTCGIIEMRLLKFMVIDLCALTCTSLILFYLGYTFGNNYDTIIPYLNRYKFIIFGLFITAIIILIIRKKISVRAFSMTNKDQQIPEPPKKAPKM
ncbi:MAG: hypothetical protein A2176_00620 [Spirochaetes bacterium RBG_13_51_14]|nr:MAG: hypothetical protein A2176_00620 [Spirochaetes bacterium RBG_13_51_14]